MYESTVSMLLPSPFRFNGDGTIQRHTQGLKVPTRFILEQVRGVEPISGIHFDLRDRLGGVLRAPLTPRRARVTNASSREKVTDLCLKTDSELQTSGRNGFYAPILV